MRDIDPAMLLLPPVSRVVPPKRIKARLPKQGTFVSLSMAVSWIGFGIALELDDLFELMQTGEIGDGVASAETRIEDAVERLLDAGVAEKARFVGKYRESRLDHAAKLTEPIPAIRLLDFRRFEPVENGLLYGRGLAHEMRDGVLTSALNEGRGDLFAEVRIDRSDLLTLFPEANMARASAGASKRRSRSGNSSLGWYPWARWLNNSVSVNC